MIKSASVVDAYQLHSNEQIRSHIWELQVDEEQICISKPACSQVHGTPRLHLYSSTILLQNSTATSYKHFWDLLGNSWCPSLSHISSMYVYCACMHINISCLLKCVIVSLKLLYLGLRTTLLLSINNGSIVGCSIYQSIYIYILYIFSFQFIKFLQNNLLELRLFTR